MAPLRESGTRRIFEVSATAIAGPEAVARELEKHVRWEPQTNEHPGAVIMRI